ncbi:MAG TPA: BON domain-containing protein [Terriglobales bacterium]|nr:BON domain-containing protein [Terriglobales bacterium]
MRTKLFALLTALILATAVMIGCSQNRANTPSAKENVEKSLDQANLKDVNVDEDRDKGVLTLKGEVKSEEDKSQAEQIAKANAGNEIVANEIAVRPEGAEHDARKIEGNVDDGIKDNLKAAFTANHLDDQHIRTDVKEGVITLKGDVDTMAQRAQAEKVAASVPNVSQVVNELKVKK